MNYHPEFLKQHYCLALLYFQYRIADTLIMIINHNVPRFGTTLT